MDQMRRRGHLLHLSCGVRPPYAAVDRKPVAFARSAVDKNQIAFGAPHLGHYYCHVGYPKIIFAVQYRPGTVPPRYRAQIIPPSLSYVVLVLVRKMNCYSGTE